MHSQVAYGSPLANATVRERRRAAPLATRGNPDRWPSEADGEDELELLRAAFDSAPDAIFLLDDEGWYLDCNEAGARLVGTDRLTIRDRHFGDFSRGEARLRTPDLWARLRRKGRLAYRHVVTDADGAEHRVDVRGRANVLPGRHVLIARIMHGERSEAKLVLSPREREVLALIAAGLNAAQVALELYLSPLTVRTHVRNAKEKLQAHTVAQAIAIALRNREIDL
jgi:PAS domain S-box-containing protein